MHVLTFSNFLLEKGKLCVTCMQCKHVHKLCSAEIILYNFTNPLDVGNYDVELDS